MKKLTVEAIVLVILFAQAYGVAWCTGCAGAKAKRTLRKFAPQFNLYIFEKSKTIEISRVKIRGKPSVKYYRSD